MISLLHTLSGVLFLATISLKIFMHIYLDFIRTNKIPFQSILFSPLIYLKCYQIQVTTKYNWVKKDVMYFCILPTYF